MTATTRGVALSKRAYLDAVAGGEPQYSVFEPSGPIDVFGDEQIAVLRSRALIAFQGATAAPLDCWHTDCYRMIDERWQVVWSQATEVAFR